MPYLQMCACADQLPPEVLPILHQHGSRLPTIFLGQHFRIQLEKRLGLVRARKCVCGRCVLCMRGVWGGKRVL